jgi:hypothetical protein
MARAVCSLAPQSGAVPFLELELELIQTQMAQKPMPRAEVYARALRASQNVKRAEVGGRAMRLISDYSGWAEGSCVTRKNKDQGGNDSATKHSHHVSVFSRSRSSSISPPSWGPSSLS